MKESGGHVYIMSNVNNTTLYTVVTSNLPARVAQHKEKVYPNSFSSKYNCIKLVYYRWFDTIIKAIAKEKKRNPHQQHQPRLERFISGNKVQITFLPLIAKKYPHH